MLMALGPGRPLFQLSALLRLLRGVQPLIVLLCGSAMLFFIHIADEMSEGDTTSIDERLVLSLRQPNDLATPIGPHWLTQSAIDISGLGGTTVLTMLTASTAGFLIAIRRRREALVLVATVISASIAKSLLKAVFGRERPSLVAHLSVVSDASFPSGHATLSAVTYLTLGAMLAHTQATTRLRVYILSIAVILVLLIGASRVFLGVHWPSDVLAGWCLGSAWALAAWMLTRSLRPKPQTA
jgi:undecaprenyl-diphosphatase